MNQSSSNGSPDEEWDDRGELVWNEFDWERYLKQQDQAVADYWRCYDQVGEHPERIDEVARQLGWAQEIEGDAGEPSDDETTGEDFEPYTMHRNPVFIATRALFASIHAAWEKLAVDPDRLPPRHAVPFAAGLRRTENSALLGVHAIDLGDHALGISELKRALAHLNEVLAALPADPGENNRHWRAFRSYVLIRLFDLREIWLRVVGECRHELNRERDGDES